MERGTERVIKKVGGKKISPNRFYETKISGRRWTTVYKVSYRIKKISIEC